MHSVCSETEWSWLFLPEDPVATATSPLLHSQPPQIDCLNIYQSITWGRLEFIGFSDYPRHLMWEGSAANTVNIYRWLGSESLALAPNSSAHNPPTGKPGASAHTWRKKPPGDRQALALPPGTTAPRRHSSTEVLDLCVSIMEAPLIIHKREGFTLFIVFKLIIYLAPFLQKSSR